MKYILLTPLLLVSLGLLQGCISAKSAPAQPAQAAASAPIPVPAPPAQPIAIGDDDLDGVNNDLDECPGTRPGVEVDSKGCEILFRFTGPLFDFDKSTLTQNAQGQLLAAAAVLKRNPAKAIEVAGHTDSKGSDEYNLKLGKRRAAAVFGFLTANGIDPLRMISKSFGESQPVATNNSSEGRAQNRRVEIVEQPE